MYSKFEIDTSMIPKVEIAEIFYQQTNTNNPFYFNHIINNNLTNVLNLHSICIHTNTDNEHVTQRRGKTNHRNI